MSDLPPPPAHDQLPEIGATGDRHAWGVWGPGDELGAINLLTPERVLAAARLVRRGRVINLNLPLNLPSPALAGGRDDFQHNVTVNRGGRDDSLDGFFLQASSQWDGLRHIRYREHGYWGGRQDEEVDRGRLGIEHWARHGIVGRAVLIDLPRRLARLGRDFDARRRFAIDGPLIEAIAAAQAVALTAGDILLLRTGWLAWYLSLDQPGREGLRNSLHTGEGGLDCPGLDAHRETAAWLWDHHIAAVGFQHRRLIALLGIAIGEFWLLEELADDCAADGRYECMLVAAPLNLPGGVGSPANAYAIK